MNKKKAFTLIELLVVVAIIGLLAGAILVSIDAARVKARGASIAFDLDQIAKALRYDFISNSSTSEFPRDTDLCASGCSRNNPQINQLVRQGLITIENPVFPDVNKSIYRYDNDGGAPYDSESCPSTTAAGSGVNIYLFKFLVHEGDSSMEIAEYLDDVYDNGDGLDCGRFRRECPTCSSMFFMIAPDSKSL